MALTPRFCCVVPATGPGACSTCVSVEYIAPSKPGSWSLVVKFGSRVATGTELLTIRVAPALVAALLRPPDEELEPELLPHAARASTATAPVRAARTPRARCPVMRFIGPPSVVRFIPSSPLPGGWIGAQTFYDDQSICNLPDRANLRQGRGYKRSPLRLDTCRSPLAGRR